MYITYSYGSLSAGDLELGSVHGVLLTAMPGRSKKDSTDTTRRCIEAPRNNKFSLMVLLLQLRSLTIPSTLALLYIYIYVVDKGVSASSNSQTNRR